MLEGDGGVEGGVGGKAEAGVASIGAGCSVSRANFVFHIYHI